MKSYANQKIIKIKRTPIKEGDLFLKVKTDNLFEACRQITNLSEMKVWLYLTANANNYEMAFSPQAMSALTGLSINSIKEGINSLINKGFLHLEEGKTAHYDFTEIPEKVKPTFTIPKRGFVNQQTGEVLYLTFTELLEIIQNEEDAKSLWDTAKERK